MKWTERWIARAQRQADLRAERFLRHQEGLRTGAEPPSDMDRLQSWITLRTERFENWGLLSSAYSNERRFNSNWPLAVRPDVASLADAWRTWVTERPVRGPDGVTVAIWIQYAGQDLPFGDSTGDPAPFTWQDLADVGKVYTVCVRRLPAGPRRGFCSFATETSARWYAVELARTVRQAGITGLGPEDIFPERRRPDRALAEELIGVRSSRPHPGPLHLPRRARARWRQLRTGRP